MSGSMPFSSDLDPRRLTQKRDSRKRLVISVASALFLYAILFLIFYLWENRRSDLDLYSGPVQITLGQPDGQDIIEQEKTQSAPPQQETPVEERNPDPAQDEASTSKPDPRPEPAETQPVSDNSAAQASAVEASENDQAQAAVAEDKGRVVQGQTYGNSHELFLDSSGGSAGRNLWVPVYLYMPVPSTLDASILDQVVGDPSLGILPEEDVRVLKYYYKKTGELLSLKSDQVALQYRPEIWIVLERNGYDLSMAPYKFENLLRPVELHFSISSDTGGSGSQELLDLSIEKSSGIEAIDQAVLFAFQQSSYYNDSEKALKGRFVYRFR